MFICVTHVDSKTKIPCFKKPMKNGPSYPDVKGLNIEWWDQSKWPLTHPDDYPKFFGTCDDDADVSLDGVVSVLTEDLYNSLREQEEFARLPTNVSPSQFRLALHKLDLYSNVLSTIEAIDEPLKTAIKIDLEFTLDIFRYSPLVGNIKDAMGWDDNTLTNIFVTAAGINVKDFES